MRFALAGNQNCGKTTLFNQLTGSNQHVGNFPGVTVDSKSGVIRNTKGDEVIDLPGIYSLRPYSAEEIVTRDFILDGKPDGIINIVDATNIERNLYLTLQMIEMQVPMVLALNMMDEVRANGGTIDTVKLSELLGIPVVPISAAKGEGIADLTALACRTAADRRKPEVYDFCPPGAVHRCIHAVTHVVEDHAERARMSPRWAAMNVIEGNGDIVARLALDENELELCEHSIVEMERETGLDRNAAIADMRYSFIESVCAETVKKPEESRERKRSRRIDNVLTHRIFALPIFIGIMLLVFYLTFEVIGAFLSDLLASGIGALAGVVDTALTAYGINPVVHSLVIDGLFGGVGNVVSFLPVIVVLFFFLSMLEDTGYMARVAFVMDKLLRRIGLSGKSIVPMLIGFGCTVPAVMATRTLTSERDRRMTVLLTPFMSCSAKIPIYSVFVAAFFPKYKALAMGRIVFPRHSYRRACRARVWKNALSRQSHPVCDGAAELPYALRAHDASAHVGQGEGFSAPRLYRYFRGKSCDLVFADIRYAHQPRFGQCPEPSCRTRRAACPALCPAWLCRLAGVHLAHRGLYGKGSRGQYARRSHRRRGALDALLRAERVGVSGVHAFVYALCGGGRRHPAGA